MTRIKLCGLTREEDINAANRLIPDYIGFVFWPKSKRLVSDTKAGTLKCMLDPRIMAVGVFVDEHISRIKELLDRKIIDAVQLHGSEDEEYIKKLKEVTDKPVIKAVKMNGDGMIIASKSSADHILLDAGMGEGRSFDWNIIERSGYDPAKIFLAGGLGPENVAEAIRKIHPYAVDVSSGIETDGIKDIGKMEEFVNAVRKADRGDR